MARHLKIAMIVSLADEINKYGSARYFITVKSVSVALSQYHYDDMSAFCPNATWINDDSMSLDDIIDRMQTVLDEWSALARENLTDK